jgi:GntR family transcriptional regulator / MocR family aminotransferase
MKRTTSELFLRVERQSGAPLRLQIERELRSAIQSGRLAAGALLPSTRALAGDLAVSRGVIVEAYEQLLAEGYLLSARGSATRVAARRTEGSLASPANPVVQSFRFDFRPGLPDFSLFPRRLWMSAMRRVLGRAPDLALDYPDSRGVHQARVALAAYLNRVRAAAAQADRIVLCNGTTQGIALLCRVLRERGVRKIAVEDPGHADQCTDIRSFGLETPRIPVDDDGIVVDRLQRTDARAVLVTPAHQYPTGSVLTSERRAALLDWAERRDTLIVEDDYDAEYRYDREPIGALQGLCPDRVAYVGTTSKTLSPALRLGWLVLPHSLAEDVAAVKLQSDRGSGVFEQLAYAELLERGDIDRHVRRTRLIYRSRRDALVGALRERFPKQRIHGVAAGLHLLMDLRPGSDEKGIVDAAASRSIRVYGGSSYYARPAAAPPSLLLGYGGIAEEIIDAGVSELEKVILGAS